MDELTTFRIDIRPRQMEEMENGRSHLQAAHQLGYTQLAACHASRLTFLQGRLTATDAEKIAGALLADPVTEEFTIDDLRLTIDDLRLTIDVTLLPGVTDPPAASLLRAAHLLGVTGLERAATGQRYYLQGDLDEAACRALAEEVFANPVIQRYALNEPIAPPFFPYQEADDTVEIIPVRSADDDALLAVSQERRLALDLAEMQAIRAYYQAEGRDPTDVELEMLAQTWSEHCVHKTFKALIEYTGPDGQVELIDGLLNQYIRAATEQINKPWVRSAFVDNAGIIAFDEQFDLAFKVETHNHPSALEPFGGANTGVGGVVRDVLGVSARPIANTDVLCFGPPDMPHDDLPAGVLHPARIADGVVHGVEDYGNKMGIPTVNGAICYDPGYTANPLVYCGCLGILPHGSNPTEVQPGDLIVALGGRTGRDGLRGATFSSMEMDVQTSAVAGTAVQIGNPIMEKQVQEVILRARDEKLYSAITDCGAGGFSSAVGEMGEHVGARVQLQDVKLKYPGLRPWEIWLSEAQERMVLAVPPANLPRLQTLCAGQDVEATILGTFDPTGHIEIFYGDRKVGDLSMAFLHNGIPRRKLKAEWQPLSREPSDHGQRITDNGLQITELLLRLLAHPDIRSKENVIRRYDHEVQGGTAVKPLTGAANHGPSDAAVIVPQPSQLTIGDAPGGTLNRQSSIVNRQSVALSNGLRPNYTPLDPYRMAWTAVDEAIRNAVAVGADPDQIAILDNFCWGNPNLPDRLGSLVRCAQGCYDAAIAYQTPFISGKDSLNNEYTGADGQKHAIPGTLLISAVGIVPDVAQTVSMDLKQAGNFLIAIGETGAELGGSHYGLIGGAIRPQHQTVPKPVENALTHYRQLHQAIRAGLVQACHDCSEGGLAVALAEMCLAGGVGAEIKLMSVPRDPYWAYAAPDAILFSESNGRFLIEVRPDDMPQLDQILADAPHNCIGVSGGNALRITNATGEAIIELPVSELEQAWRGHLEDLRLAEKRPTVNRQSSIVNQKSPRVLILHANGTNRDHDAALAVELAGGAPEVVHINQLLAGERRLRDYGMLIVPGGFSYGDDLGAGALWAVDLQYRLNAEIAAFAKDGRPILGICNGFQVLVKAGLLPGIRNPQSATRNTTLTHNASGHFECRWVTLQPNPASPSLFTQGLTEPIACPVAHGEGRLVVKDEATLAALQAQNLIPLQYSVSSEQSSILRQAQDRFVNRQSSIVNRQSSIPYPFNPNGSIADIAALCNPAGNVMGLMPHPENHIFPWQRPRGAQGVGGLALFVNGMKNI
ncbi:MAG: phosphoribosylformylglycinamidine synthase subunit PurL [Anaerolinea sp.]|nr:phosphoribosylformylglycinamidine synthase subunit PurL [Anaerolinea sp.]